MPSPDTQSDPCRLFILRVWQDGPGGPLRYMLKAADDNHRRVFASAQSLADFLEKTPLTLNSKVENA
jgi:hypothetical protein